MCVAERLLASDHALNASRLVSAVQSLRTMHTSIGHEEGSLAEHLVAAVNVAADDTVEDGLSGRNDNDVNPTQSVITPEILSRRWGVGLDTAKRTLQVTTQSGIRNFLARGERKVSQKLDHLAFPNLSGKWKSVRGPLTAQVFTNGRGSNHFYLMKNKGLADPNALMPFIQEVGIPRQL